MSKTTDLFTERFRPKDLNTLIAPDRVKKQLENGLIQNLMLSGPAGTGKTSLAKILASEHDFMYINASADGRIGIIESISDFCATVSLTKNLLDGKNKKVFKVIILDEVDGASDEFFKALRPVLEKYHKTARFIMTCNYINKIPEPILSRTTLINMYPINTEEEDFIFKAYVKRTAAILNAIKVKYTTESIIEFVKACKTDMRSLINKIQTVYNSGTTELNMKDMCVNSDFKILYDVCMSPNQGKAYENYKLITAEYSAKINDSMFALGTDFIEYLRNNYDKNTLDSKIPQILICVAEYQHILSQGPTDPLITLLACVAKLQIILN